MLKLVRLSEEYRPQLSAMKEDGPVRRYRIDLNEVGIVIRTLNELPEQIDRAAAWFHERWGIPEEAYRESMEESLRGNTPVPRWFLAFDGERIAGGCGVIENDFHPRTDLSPNVCAVYVDVAYRGRGIAGSLLDAACRELSENGIRTLYLLTDHEGFYERYGWEFFCEVTGNGESEPSRMYVHRVGESM